MALRDGYTGTFPSSNYTWTFQMPHSPDLHKLQSKVMAKHYKVCEKCGKCPTCDKFFENSFVSTTASTNTAPNPYIWPNGVHVGNLTAAVSSF